MISQSAPKYRQLADVLTQEFATAPVGHQLPPIAALAHRHGVSKVTLNRAIHRLVSKGLVKAQRGRGTVIIRPFLAAPATHAVGLILCPRVGTPHPTENVYEVEILAGLQHRLADEGFSLSSLVVDDPNGYGLQRQLAMHKELAGYVFMVDMLDRPTAQQVARLRRPCVVINEDQFQDLLTCVVAEEEAGMAEAVRHLAQLGHRRIALVWMPNPVLDARRRGYEAAVRENGLDADPTLVVEVGQMDAAALQVAGMQLAGRFASSQPACSAIITSGIELAHGLTRGLNTAGRKVGEDISVLAFGTATPESGDSLTCVSKPRYEMGRCAADVLLHQIRQHYEQVGLIKLKTTLHAGRSTGPCQP